MVTIGQRGVTQDWQRIKFYGKSTDQKPLVEFSGEKIGNASMFYEMDTKKSFLYDEEMHEWIEQ